MKVDGEGLPAGLILAGGRGQRLGGADKALLALAGRPLLAHVIDRLAPQVGHLAVNANGDATRIAAVCAGLPIVPDPIPDHPGPLAGLLAGLEWLALAAPAVTDLVTVTVDCPFLPTDLVARLRAARAQQGGAIACARGLGPDGGAHRHPTIALWPVRLAGDLRHALVSEGVRKVGEWAGRHGVAFADYPAFPRDPFFNINRPEDLAAAALLVATAG